MISDYQRWWDYHCQMFSGFGKFMADNPAQPRMVKRMLEPYSLEKLQEATEAMFEAPKKPFFGNHAAWIRDYMRSDLLGDSEISHGPTVTDDQLTAKCTRCMDYGLVSVLSPGTLRRLRRGQTGVLTTCSVVCDCRAGNGRRGVRWDGRPSLVPYEPIMDEAVSNPRPGMSLDERMWAIASEIVLGIPEPAELSGE